MRRTTKDTVPTASDDFFITGGTIPTDATCYITRKADLALYTGLSRGAFCYVLNTRQMGKSSLMVRTAQRLRQESACVAVLDLTSLGQNLTLEQWYFGLLARLGEQIGLEFELVDFWKANRERGPLHRWLDALREVVLPALDASEPLIIFIDEIDAVRNLSFSTDEFFAGIRECYNRRAVDPQFKKLTFCLLGVATPADLIRNVRLSPFNIGERILLTDFTPAEAASLAQGIAGMTPDRALRLVRRVLYWTGGHPYLTQRLCRAVAEHNVESTGEVDKLCAAMFLTRDAVETDDNLAFVRNRLLQSDCDLVSLLDLYQRVLAGKPVPDDETNPLCNTLRLSGVARSVHSQLRLRNPIYKHVFDRRWALAQMPDAEQRRQRRAYQRGLLRAASVAAILIAVFATLTGVARFQAQAARLARDQAQRNLLEEERQRNRADGLNERLQVTLRQKEQVNRQLQVALNAERSQRQAAQRARRSEEARRHEAEVARQEALHQQHLATAQLSQNYLATGLQAIDSGDPLAAVAPLRAAMHLDNQDPGRMELHRIRLASILAQSPRSLHLWRFAAHIAAAQFCPDGKRILTACADGSARIWDVESGQAVVPPMHHHGAILTAAYSPDGKFVVTGGADRQACLWDARTGARLASFPHPAPVLCAAWSRDGQRITTACFSHILRWSAQARGQVRTPLSDDPATGGNANAVAISPDDTRMTVIFSNFLAWQSNAQTGEDLFPPGTAQGAVGDVRCYMGRHVEYSPDNRTLLIAGIFGKTTFLPGACLYDVITGRALLPVFKHLQPGTDARFSPDGKRIVTASEDGMARIWNASDGLPLSPWLRHVSRVTSASFSPDGDHILTAGDDGSVRLWDGFTGDPVGPPLHENAGVQGACFDSNGKNIVTVNRDNTVHLWRLPGQDPAIRVAFQPGNMDPDRTQLLWHRTRLITRVYHRITDRAYGFDPCVYDSASGRLLFRLPFEATQGGDYQVSRDERTVCLFTNRLARVWDLQTGRALTPLLTAKRTRLSPDGSHLLIWHTSNAVEVLELGTGRRQPLNAVMQDVEYNVFSHQGRFAALCTEPDCIRIFDIVLGRWRSGRLNCHDPILNVCYSAFDNRLFVVTRTVGIQLWDTLAGRCLATVQPPKAPDVEKIRVTFSPEGRYAVTYTMNPESPATFWDVQAGRIIAQRSLYCDTVPLRWLPAHSGSKGAEQSETRVATFAVGGTQPRLWDAAKGRAITPILAHNAEVSYLAFRADGRRMVTASADGTARIWETFSGMSVTPPMRHQGRVMTAEFSPDGRYVLTGAEDGATRLWSAETGEAVTLPVHHPGPVLQVQFLGHGAEYLAVQPPAVYRERISLDDVASRRRSPQVATTKRHHNNAVALPNAVTASIDPTPRRSTH